MATLRLPAKMEYFDQFRALVLQSAVQSGSPNQKLPEIDLVLEELLTNVIRYAYPDEGGQVEVSCFVESSRRFCFSITDWGRPFDPLSRETPSFSDDISTRQVGGLGIYLVRQTADEVHYQRCGECNILKVCFDWDG